MRETVEEALQDLREVATRGAPLGLTPPTGRSGEGQRRSAVLMLFGTLDDVPPNLDVLLIRRSDGSSHHAGQIAFPGGGMDPEDRGDPAVTALREAAEETSLDPHGIEVLGAFPDAHLPVSANLVTPVLGWWRLPSDVAADHAESVEVFRVPVAELLNPAARGATRIRFEGRVYSGPAFCLSERFGGRIVWGFTGILLSTLFDQLGWAEPWSSEQLFDVGEPARGSRG